MEPEILETLRNVNARAEKERELETVAEIVNRILTAKSKLSRPFATSSTSDEIQQTMVCR
jgi:hypothetical protein